MRGMRRGQTSTASNHRGHVHSADARTTSGATTTSAQSVMTAVAADRTYADHPATAALKKVLRRD